MICEDLLKFYKDNKTIIFDLDNTLYAEDEYLFGAYKKIAYTQQNYDNLLIYKFLYEEYKKNGRSRLLDKLKKNFPKLDLSLNEMLDLIHNYDGSYIKLELKKWFLDFLNSVNSDFVIRIITNGNIIQQKNKINLLNIENLGFETDTVYANKYGGKPNKEPYNALVGSKLFYSPVYIGDNEIDELFSRNLGIDFYHV
ncbi:MAG: HAD hydrolase-like protein [Gammaproteobacteria bacterium]|tara:strand:+ start:381 stop:971 length:591 start_codon:yes stop_codon:yes gene_type:complete